MASPSLFGSTLRIIFESFAYRLKMREANNLPVVITLAVAFRLPMLDILARAAIAVILNVLVYLTNDYLDIDIDLRGGDEPRAHTAYLAANRRGAQLALGLLCVLLCGAGLAHQRIFDSWVPLIGAIGGAITVWAYSAWLKRQPVVDVLSMAVAGAFGSLVGIASAGTLGYRIAIFLGLVCGSFNAMQVLRDLQSDTAHGVRTTAVVFGPTVAALLYRGLMAAAAIYGVFAVSSWSALVLLAALPWRINSVSASRAWDIARIAGALSWVGLLAELYLGRLR